MSDRLYKVVSQKQWRSAEADGVFTGAAIDLSDGFIHLSTGSQVVETVRLHFAGQTDLALIEVDPGPLGSQLRWEPSRGGEPFPHLYGELPLTAVLRVEPLPWVDGEHQFPGEI